MFDLEGFKNNELKMFYNLAKTDLLNGFSKGDIIDGLTNLAEAYYGTRMEFDPYAIKKCYFIISHMIDIVHGDKLDSEFDELKEEINNMQK